MYHLKVELAGRKMSELVPTEDDEYMEVFREPLDREGVEFSVGNPRVEHVTGIVHLYKRNTPTYGSQGAWSASAALLEEPEVSQTLCCLAIPADMSVAQFCTFIGAYLAEVRSIQVLRREGSQPSVCMVLLTFATQDQADSFFNDFNSMPFSSLEPDILCRLVYVRTVEVLSSRGRPPSVALPAAAKALTAASAAGSTPAESATAAAAASAEAAGQDDNSQAVGTASALRQDKSAGSKPAGSMSPSSAARAAAQDAKVMSDTAAAAAAADAPAGDNAAPAKQQQQSTGSSHSASETHQQSYAAAVAGHAVPAVPAAASSAPAAATSAAAAAPEHWLEPPPGTTELPTCPVCLERLDEHISGIVTTVCNHRFHGECLKHWGDTSCPVCRYCMLSSSTSTSSCSTCGTHSNLWICLICGHVGCGRYKQGHANDHWKASSHCYALELETQRVWDYAGDGYVHRLIQSKTDGKLVEVPSPAPTCPHGSPSRHHHHHHCRHHPRRPSQASSDSKRGAGSSAAAAAAGASGGGYSGAGSGEGDADACSSSSSCPVCADEQQVKEAMVSSKLEAITLEYNHLLATQLDSQRQYFEGLLAQQEAKQQALLTAAKAAAEQAQSSSAAAAAVAKESERKRQQLDRKLSELTASVTKVSEEREFLRSLNETLLSNQKDFNTKLASAQAELAAKDAQLADLNEQVRDLMVYIEAQRTIQSEGGSELQDATLLPMPASSRTSSNRSSRRSSKK